jgi:hypothetical protein
MDSHWTIERFFHLFEPFFAVLLVMWAVRKDSRLRDGTMPTKLYRVGFVIVAITMLLDAAYAYFLN